jgi:hypothetical protein
VIVRWGVALEATMDVEEKLQPASEQLDKPLVSVVMVVCNVERFLAEAIESILGQTYTEFEFIIADFGSADNSKSIVSSYAAKDSRIRLHEILPFGLIEARNTACSLARGRYIAMMDADDVAAPNRLELQFAFMQEHPQVGLLGGATEWINASGMPLRLVQFPTEDHEIRLELANRCPFSHPAAMIRSEAFALVGGYRTKFAQAEDYDLWLRIAEHFKVANLKEVVLLYRIHPYQLTLRKRLQQTLCVFAAQVSASSRRNGNPDPLDSIEQITPAFLVAAGVTEAAQQVAAASDYLVWLRTMSQAGEYSSAIAMATQLLRSPEWKYIERWQTADLYLAIARLYWKEKRYLKSLLAAGRAVATRPVVIGRPLKPMLERIGLA